MQTTLDGVAGILKTTGVEFDPVATGAGFVAEALAELAGGMDEFARQNQAFNDIFYTAEERKNLALAESAQQVNGLTEVLNGLGITVPNTNAEFLALRDGLDLNTERGRFLHNLLTELGPAFNDVTTSGMSTEAILAQLPESMRSNFQQAVDFGIDGGTQLANNWADAMGAIVTQTNNSGGDFVGSISRTLDAIVNDASISGDQLEGEISAALEAALREAGAFSGEMPAEMRPGFDAAVAAAAAFATELRGSSGVVQGATSTANGALGGFGSAIESVATAARNAAKTALDSAISAVGSSRNSAEAMANINRINLAYEAAEQAGVTINPDGSYAEGLGTVPWDGFIAELHKGEMVVPAGAADMIRKLDASEFDGGAANQPFRRAVSVTPSGQGGARDDSALLSRIDKLIAQNEKLSRENAEHAKRRDMKLGQIADGTERNVMATKDAQQESERTGRELMEAIAS